MNDKPSKLLKQEVIDWFGNKAHYIDFHQKQQMSMENRTWAIEED
jgi:hypothetical protein